MPGYLDCPDYLWTGDLSQFSGTDFLCPGACREKRTEVQDVQVPHHVSGCGGAEEGTDGAEPGERRDDVQDGL